MDQIEELSHRLRLLSHIVTTCRVVSQEHLELDHPSPDVVVTVHIKRVDRKAAAAFFRKRPPEQVFEDRIVLSIHAVRLFWGKMLHRFHRSLSAKTEGADDEERRKQKSEIFA